MPIPSDSERAGACDGWHVHVGPGQWVPLREVVRSVSAPDDPTYRKVLAAMVDPRQTPEVGLRRYFWGVALRQGDADLIEHLAAAAAGETDAVILGAVADWRAAHGGGLPLLPPPGSPFPELPDPPVMAPVEPGEAAASPGSADSAHPLPSFFSPGQQRPRWGHGD